MKQYAIQEKGRFHPIMLKKDAKRYGADDDRAIRYSHANRGVVARYLKEMQSIGAWHGAEVVTL